MAPVKPLPTLPANRSLPSSYTPTAIAPRSCALPLPGVQPPTTSSCSGRILILSQDRCACPARTATGGAWRPCPRPPSPPAASKNAFPSRSTCAAKRTRGMVLQHAPQQPLAILERDVQQRPTIEVQQVEGLVHEPARLLVPELGLQQAEVGPAVLVEGHDLAVDDGLARLDPAAGCTEQAREVRLRVVEVPRQDPDLAVVDDGLDPEPVPLDLEQPVVVVERLGRERRQHRLDVLGQRRGLGPGEVDLGRRGRRLADPDGVAVLLDLVVGPTGLDALRDGPRRPSRAWHARRTCG